MTHASRAYWFDDNRANWDDRAAVHEASGYGIAELLASPEAITAEIALDRDRLGELNGREVIHLQCHLGLDTISLARMGAARVVGLDLSGESLRRARAIAERAGANIDFVEANVYDARAAVTGDFDVLYTSIGVLCWLPDVAGWARVIVSLLKPGGRLVFRDDHPVFQAIGDDLSNGPVLREPYFQAVEPSTWEDDTSYVGPVGDAPAIIHTRSHQWNHSVAEIITALLDAGLVIDEVTETRYSAWRRWPDAMEPCPEGFRFIDKAMRNCLPLQLAVVAHRPTPS